MSRLHPRPGKFVPPASRGAGEARPRALERYVGKSSEDTEYTLEQIELRLTAIDERLKAAEAALTAPAADGGEAVGEQA